MRLTIDYGWDGLRRRVLGCAAGLLLALPAGLSAQPSDVPAASPAPSQAVAPARPTLPWIDEVVKMNAAGVPPDVIKNYIANSSSRSSLTADDIIYLRNSGVASDIIAAMITHGAMPPTAVASMSPQAPPSQYSQYYPPQQQYQPPVEYSDQAAPPDYDYEQPYSYSYGYNYGYPAYYPYYPAYWYPYTTFFVGGRNRGFFPGGRVGRSSFGSVGGRTFGGSRTTAGGHIGRR